MIETDALKGGQPDATARLIGAYLDFFKAGFHPWQQIGRAHV